MKLTKFISFTCSSSFSFNKEVICEYLNEKMPEEENIDVVLDDFRPKHDDIYQGVLTMLEKCNKTTAKAGTTANGMDDGNDDDEDDNAGAENGFEQPSTNGINTRPIGIASTSAASNRGRGRGRGAKRTTVSEEAAETSRGRGRGRAKRTKK